MKTIVIDHEKYNKVWNENFASFKEMLPEIKESNEDDLKDIFDDIFCNITGSFGIEDDQVMYDILKEKYKW